MFIPIGDSPNFRETPWVNYTLIAVNILVFLALLPQQLRPADPDDPAARAYVRVLAAERGVVPPTVTAYDATVFRAGFKPAAPRVKDALTSMFLHGGWMHLFGNMLFLWIYGDNVEHRLGRLGYLVAYLAMGVAAAMGDSLLRPGSLIPAVGASGAISGVLGFYFLWFPRNRIRVWIFFFPFFADIIELPARVVLLIYLVLDNILPALLTGGEGAVAYGAHLGGFFAALLTATLLDRYVLRRPERDLRRQRPPKAVPHPGEALRRALDDDDLTSALDIVGRTPAHSPVIDPLDVLELADRLADAGHPHAALAMYQRIAGTTPRGPAAARARVGAARILARDLGLPTEAYQQLALAADAGPDPETAARIRDALGELARSGTIPHGRSAPLSR